MLNDDPQFPPREWISAIRTALDFAPSRSLIVILVPDQHTDDARASLSYIEFSASAPILAAWLRRRIATTGTGLGYAILIDDRLTPATADPDHRGYRLVEYLTDALTEGPLLLAASWATRELARDQPWWPLSGHRDATTPPQSASTPKAGTPQRAAAGVAVLELTQALHDVLTADFDLVGAVAAELPAALDACSRRALADHDEHVRSLNRRDLELVLEAIAEIADGAVPNARHLARVAAALSVAAVSQCLHATAAGDHADAAEALWAMLGRCLPGPLRATPVMLLAYSAFLRGDGGLASLATSVALHANPREITAHLIYTALENRLAPEALYRIARFGAAAATDLGITIDYTAPD
ncbi:DUF4192 domain-containing protein [Nocardia noduli]|uniref:DUF4192 domain-containing protein n=1 Tax=Nocardia noduli TaxID=2815722 RepID=UPI001C2287B4|nr:DUF4192 domain-containing protein [Nocardia noduli]